MAAIPVPYIGTGIQNQVALGHYGVAQKSGASVSIAAAGILGSLRWAPTLSNLAFAVVMRIKAGWIVTAQITTATPMDLSAFLVRGFTVDFTTASTAASLVTQTNFMRSGTMRPSQMGANGPRICTTAVMSGQTATADANAFAMTTWPAVVSTNATGTIATVVLGMAGNMQTVYEWTALGGHPPVLNNNEGYFLQTVTANTTGGSIAYYFQHEWAECLAF